MNQIIDRANAVRMRLFVLPTALVAWADGRLDSKERSLLEEIALANLRPARDPATMAYARWLESIPTQDDVEAWVRLVNAFVTRLTPQQRSSFVAKLEDNLWKMARVSGWPQPVSANERAVIRRIEAILHAAAAPETKTSS